MKRSEVQQGQPDDDHWLAQSLGPKTPDDWNCPGPLTIGPFRVGQVGVQLDRDSALDRVWALWPDPSKAPKL